MGGTTTDDSGMTARVKQYCSSQRDTERNDRTGSRVTKLDCGDEGRLKNMGCWSTLIHAAAQTSGVMIRCRGAPALSFLCLDRLGVGIWPNSPGLLQIGQKCSIRSILGQALGRGPSGPTPISAPDYFLFISHFSSWCLLVCLSSLRSLLPLPLGWLTEAWIHPTVYRKWVPTEWWIGTILSVLLNICMCICLWFCYIINLFYF